MEENAERPLNQERPLIVGIGGATCSGKTTTSLQLKNALNAINLQTVVIEQDQFYFADLSHVRIEEMNYWNFDSAESINAKEMVAKIRSIEQGTKVIIVEGNLIYAFQEVRDLMDLRFNFTVDQRECEKRRKGRKYSPPDVNDYFEQYVWPQHKQRLAEDLKSASDYTWIDCTEQKDNSVTSQVLSVILQRLDSCWLTLSNDNLDILAAINYANDNGNGAISIFIGTVRGEHEKGRSVAYLEYEAYKLMALTEMYKICKNIRQQWPSIGKIALHHRLGKVPTNGLAMIVVVGAPHRAEPLEAMATFVGAIKKQVPIWKQEILTDGTVKRK